MSAPALPPIHRAVSVSWDPASAFRRFTSEFAEWWPSRTHSIGGPRVKRIVFETRPGGRIFEEHLDGRRFQWGQVLDWEPPHRVKFTWHPSRDPATAQEVEVRFTPEDSGSRVELISTHWERWGEGAVGARRGYNLGWWYVLNHWAGHRTAGMVLMDGLTVVATLAQRLKGGRAASIERARGEMTRA